MSVEYGSKEAEQIRDEDQVAKLLSVLADKLYEATDVYEAIENLLRGQGKSDKELKRFVSHRGWVLR